MIHFFFFYIHTFVSAADFWIADFSLLHVEAFHFSFLWKKKAKL